MNGIESDVDCGGVCAPCKDLLGCFVASDCVSKVCTFAKCSVPACSDAVKNGVESDVDCGGSCPACKSGRACRADADCASKICTGGICVSKAIYLGSDLVADSASVGWGNYVVDGNWYRQGFAIAGVQYSKGFFAHAVSSVKFNLGKKYATFEACAGLDDGDGNGGSVVFSVHADGALSWTSPRVTGGQAATCVTGLDVKGKSTLELRADNGGDGIGGDESEWVNAIVRE
jgi:hypothetical protein